jgi:UDP-N-acetyl-D-mannosaminuronic acid transferase (WecB/TagA/CpsF family)
MPYSSATVLGVPFFRGSLESALERARAGGLVVAPSGPGLAWDLMTNLAYREAVTTAEVALADSGFMIILSRFLPLCPTPPRISGLRFLEALLKKHEVSVPGNSFWLMPSESELVKNLAWLRAHGFPHLTPDDCHVAPFYPRRADGAIMDEVLLDKLEQKQPKWVFLNVGSGVQEPLGFWLRGRLSYDPALICTGAAIAFLAGGQAHIPHWVDQLYLGWLFRILDEPKKFLPRYVRALRLFWLLIRWQDSLPPQRTREGPISPTK